MVTATTSDSDLIDDLARRYLTAQLRGDRREALRLLLDDGLNRGVAPSILRARVVRWAQERIGALWELNEVTIAQEHIATAIANHSLSHLFEHTNVGQPVGLKVLVSCVEGELHEFPARLVADALEEAGIDVRFVGASVPLESLLDLITRERPDVIALSVTMSFNLDGLRKTVPLLRQRFPSLPLLVGGRALKWSPSVANELGIDEIPLDADIVALVRAAARKR